MKSLILPLLVLVLLCLVEGHRRPRRQLEVWVRPEKGQPPPTRECQPWDRFCRPGGY
ncbi:uncharacterized protein Sfp70A4 [Drosophila takahashii]|uniref:uncharacterized protein Sfp70A4 n=1 Tax=Drosophila takahashii TaxID=29030 RepID=UPI0007E8AF71|nr:uncharacterized protein LOC108063481 [Drosophila takahashii]